MGDWWQSLWRGLTDEVGNLPDPEEAIRILVRLVIAALLGGLLGFERERTGKAAGLRTHMLVSLGTAFLVAACQRAGMASADVSRVIQGIITGVGFLGAGTILKRSHPREIRGLTTAAGIWMAAAVGVAAGLGRTVAAILATLLALGVLALVPHISRGDDDGPSAA